MSADTPPPAETAGNLMLLSTLAAAVVGLGLSHHATNAIHDAIITGAPIPPDYWPELQRCTDMLRELVEILEGTE